MLVPYYTEQGQALNTICTGLPFALLVYVSIVVSAWAPLGRCPQYLQWPTLERIRIATIPGVLERLESVFIGVWVVVALPPGESSSDGKLKSFPSFGLAKETASGTISSSCPCFLGPLPRNIVAVELYAASFPGRADPDHCRGGSLLYLVALLRRQRGR